MKSPWWVVYNKIMEESMADIKCDRCDDCGCKGLGVMHEAHVADHVLSPVLFLCRQCDPTSFDNVARRDIDTWLEGGELGC